MKEHWNVILQFIFTLMSKWLGWFFGRYDGLFLTLSVFVVIDYITRIMCAVMDKRLSNEIGFMGIFQKILIFIVVGIGNILDTQVIGNGSVLRDVVIFFYLSNTGVSLLENIVHLGLPIPETLRNILNHLNNKDQ